MTTTKCQLTESLPLKPQGNAVELVCTAWFGFRVWLRNLRHWKTARAYRDLTAAMKRDLDFAHTWQCNIACPLMDAGMNHRDANAAADRLMRHLFGVVNYTEPNDQAKQPAGRNSQTL